MARAKKEESNVVVVDTNSIKKEVMDYVDSEMDKRIEKFVTEKVKKEFVEEIEKANRKVIREKNKKIFIKNIFLIIFFLIIVFLLYLLYTENYFDKFFDHNNKATTNEVVPKNDDPVLEVEPNLDELINEYGGYIDAYKISNNSGYINDYYSGNLTDELKNYITLNTMDFSKIDVEEDYNIIDGNMFKDICSGLFDSKCRLTNFDYNGNKVRYFDKLGSLVSNSLLEQDEGYIQRAIVDIKVDDDTVEIYTVEGIVVDNQIYSVSPSTLIGDYNGDLVSYQEQLNKVTYTFKNKKLVSIK